MGRFFYFSLGLIAATSALAAPVDEEKPHGRVCLSLYEPGPPEKEEAFQISAPAGVGKTVRAYIDASDKCSVLVAAMTKDGKLVNGWRPQLSEVPAEYEEILLPNAPVKWDWSTASGPFDLYVLFLAPGSKEIEEAKKLVDAMQNPKVDGPGPADGETKGADRPARDRQGQGESGAGERTGSGRSISRRRVSLAAVCSQCEFFR